MEDSTASASPRETHAKPEWAEGVEEVDAGVQWNVAVDVPTWSAPSAPAPDELKLWAYQSDRITVVDGTAAIVRDEPEIYLADYRFSPAMARILADYLLALADQVQGVAR